MILDSTKSYCSKDWTITYKFIFTSYKLIHHCFYGIMKVMSLLDILSKDNNYQIKRKILIGKEDKVNFKYLGLNVTPTNSTITLDQYQYIQNLHKIEIHAD